MVDEETLYNATADLVIANIRRYVLAYVPTCENPVAAACEDAAAPMFFTLMNNVMELVKSNWNDELEQQDRKAGQEERWIVFDEYAHMMRDPICRIAVDSDCFNLASALVLSISEAPGLHGAKMNEDQG